MAQLRRWRPRLGTLGWVTAGVLLVQRRRARSATALTSPEVPMP